MDAGLRGQRDDRHRATAVLLKDAVGAPVSTGSVTGDRVRVEVRWAAPAARRGPVRPGAARRQGRFGRPDLGRRARQDRPAPLTREELATEALLCGLGAAAVVGALATVGRRLAVRVLDRIRADAWEREWAETGPRWGRSHT
ncbi:hypothetical protein NKH77_08475 [Streptomyces sp. M19]